jgi:hypothetical protein
MKRVALLMSEEEAKEFAYLEERRTRIAEGPGLKVSKRRGSNITEIQYTD